jgi:hypothetical protein
VEGSILPFQILSSFARCVCVNATRANAGSCIIVSLSSSVGSTCDQKNFTMLCVETVIAALARGGCNRVLTLAPHHSLPHAARSRMQNTHDILHRSCAAVSWGPGSPPCPLFLRAKRPLPSKGMLSDPNSIQASLKQQFVRSWLLQTARLNSR